MLSLRQKTKGQGDQLGSSKGPRVEGIRSLLGSQRLLDPRDSSEPSETIDRHAKYIREEHCYRYTRNWHRIEPPGRIFTDGFEGCCITTRPMNLLHVERPWEFPIIPRFTHWNLMLIQRKKEGAVFLVMLFKKSRYKDESQTSLVCKQGLCHQLEWHSPTTWNMHNHTDDYLKHNQASNQ